MTTRSRRSAVLFVLVSALCLLAAPAMAWAAGPVDTPQTIRTEAFEQPLAADWTLAPVVIYPDATDAYWGRLTQRSHGGSYGLWCAGSVPASWPLYPFYESGVDPNIQVHYTRGKAVLAVPQTADYYSSTLEYWYTMPSVGANDDVSFSPIWEYAGDVSGDSHPGRPLTALGSWDHETWDLTAPSNYRNLSRVASQIRFWFFGLGGHGEGVTIDDVTVAGFKFGPVRDLSATAADGAVHLSWQMPRRSTQGSAVEERPIAYRVYRSSDTSPAVWTELTTSRISATTFDDPAPPAGYSLYAVQAWDPGTGAGYGKISLPADAVRVGVGPDLPPTTSAVLNPAQPNGLNGWYRSVFPLTSVARDGAGTTYARWDSESWASSTSSLMTVAAPSDGLGGVRQGLSTLHHYGVSTQGTTEPERAVPVKFDSGSPTADFVVDGGAATTPVARISIDSTMSDAVSGPGYMAVSIDGGASYDATRAFTPHAPVDLGAPGLYTVRVRYWDMAGNEDPAVHERTITLLSEVPTSVTIRTSAKTARIGQVPILSGAVTPDSMVGHLMVVYVMKPGKTYWTYSSNRIVYSLAGHAAWQYKYYFKPGMAKGYYKFKAVIPTQTGFRTSTSPTTVTLRLY